MSLNDIRLSPILVASLYPHSLVQPQTLPAPATVAGPAATGAVPAAPAWISLGDNSKKVLVAVDYTGTRHLPDDELEFLIKILTACQLSLADVAIINKNNYRDISSKEILQHFQPGKAILLGITPEEFDLPVSFPAYQLQQVGATRFFHAPPLSTDKSYREMLWACLKQLFGI
ncbi:MAG TPA: hypothetical protein PKC69_02525 [Chitinophagaceae bacterium]|nr:hypothetical protein [Chitinophagaceae bacterium]